MKAKYLLMSILVGACVWTIPAFATQPIEYVHNSYNELVKEIDIDLKHSPTIRNFNDTYYISTDFIKTYISGASLSWDSATKETKVSLEGKVYSFKAEDKVISGIGIDYPLSTPVLVRDSKTWVPMKAFMQAIGGDAEYNPTTRTMKVQLPLIEVERLNTPPVANFEFEAESYIEGQDFNVIEKSTDPDGHLLTDKKWKIEGQTTEYKSFNELKKHLQVGTNTISLKVKDSLDRWGEWTSKTVVIEANQAPVITKITTDKSSYSQGEPILFGDYEYENESWEQIVEEKWTYRAMDQAEGQLQENKPYKLFTEGKYQVTLQVKDSFGKWSVPYSMELLVTDEVIQSELMYRFTEGETGDILENYKSFNFQEFEAVIPSRATYTGATLLMSNSPESVGSKGVLYEDTFQGEGRILYHHKNNSTDDSKKRFVILMENTNTFPI
ncbi:MAG: stalk domain-containing protein, partial [Niameybacter sp.]